MKAMTVVLWVIGGLVVFSTLSRTLGSIGLSEGQALPIGRVDFAKLKDGTYIGTHEGGRWTNKVQVKVASGKVTDIAVLKNVWFPIPGVAKGMAASVIRSQSLQVDTVSGATVTTKAYLKAVENAVTAAR
jgi:uncharacterized protein with FMN-binding domain